MFSFVVGYATKNLRSGATIVTPQFIGVADADGKIPLQSITCRDEDSDSVFLSTLDSVGATVKIYNWINYGGELGNESCWIDADTMDKPDPAVTFDPGQALWVQADSKENAFVTAGQVGTKDITVQLQNGSTMSGNASPVAIDLQDITCRDEDSDCVFLSTLDSAGATVKIYNWINYGGEYGNESYWIDADTMDKPDPAVTFKPGDGFWVQGSSTENEITLPAVEL